MIPVDGSVRVVLSVDVEEEGLFTGRYDARAAGVSNVSALRRLEFVTREFGVPLTLLATWPVLADASCAAELRRWQDGLGAEIGLHLHPWNTPPLADHASGLQLSESLPEALLDAKLATLAGAAAAVSGRRTVSFRMGRFDLGPKVLGLLPRHGVRVDSSQVPLRFVPGLPDHFSTPAEPFRLGGLTEVPLTVVPLLPGLDRAALGLARLLPRPLGQGLLSGFRRVAAVGPQPAWYPLASMELAARLHLARGGQVIHLFLHSSELAPGFAPHLPDHASVDRLLARIRAFLAWLSGRHDLRGATLAEFAAPEDPA